MGQITPAKITVTKNTMNAEIVIKDEKLTDKEIARLTKRIVVSEHIVYIKHNFFQNLKAKKAYVNKQFAGVCCLAIINKKLNKIGPMIVLEDFEGMGIASRLLKETIDQHKDVDLFIHSSNPAMIKVINKYKFTKIDGFRNLPLAVVTYLLSGHILRNMDFKLVKYFFKKRLFKTAPKADNYIYFATK